MQSKLNNGHRNTHNWNINKSKGIIKSTVNNGEKLSRDHNDGLIKKKND